jgi:hypothetical protein
MGWQLYRSGKVPLPPSEATGESYKLWADAVTDELNTTSQVVHDVRDFGSNVGLSTEDATDAVKSAVAALPTEGGTLFFPPGTYPISGTVTISVPVSIVGVHGATIIENKLPIDSDERLFDCQTDNVLVTGVTFDGQNAPAGTLTSRHVMVWVGETGSDVYDVHIRGNRFINLDRKGAADAGGNASTLSEYGIYLAGANRCWVEDNYFDEVSGCAIFVVQCDSVWIQRNHVDMLASGDVLFPIHVRHTCENVYIRDNFVGQGRTASGGAIDIMSQEGAGNVHNKKVYVENNVIDGSSGFGSGSNVIRFLSVEDGRVAGNLIRNTSDRTMIHIYADARNASGVSQPGPVRNIIEGNVLIPYDRFARGIDVRNAHVGNEGGYDVIVRDNILGTDSDTTYFTAGIRVRDIAHAVVSGNISHYSFDPDETHSYGIDISSVNTTTPFPQVTSNVVHCHSTVTSYGIVVQGATLYPLVVGNTVRTAMTNAIRIESTVTSPTVYHNVFDTPPTVEVFDESDGETARRGNRYEENAASWGTFQIDPSVISTIVNTAEIRANDMVTTTITSNNDSDEQVKVLGVVSGVSFELRTLTHTVVPSAKTLTGTWMIHH